jgi:SAM-dependent methyltransferase
MIKGILNRFAVNSSRVHLHRYNAEFAKDVPAGALVLDAGAGEAPYRDLFQHARYESADFTMAKGMNYAPPTYVCDLASIPVEAERFDFVVFNQVLEHVPDPIAVLRELCRVMKPGGKIICTTPLFYEEHMQPFDFYRYTQFAHRHMFDRAGLAIDRLEWMEGYFGTVAYQLETAAKYLPIRPGSIAPGWRGWAAAPIVLAFRMVATITAIVFYRLDIAAPRKVRGYPKNYAVIATKPHTA